jgi:hypothetical protein
MSVVIQSASVDDAVAIAGVQISSLRAADQDLIPDHLVDLVLEPADPRRRPRGWRGWLARSRVSTAVARVDGALVGFCTLHPAPDSGAREPTGEIAALFVLPSH